MQRFSTPAPPAKKSEKTAKTEKTARAGARMTADQSAALIARRIVLLRGQKVLLDSDLAALYGAWRRGG